MKKLIILVATTLFSPIALAEMPFTFNAGTPAKASEVNQNFSALDLNVKSVESQIKALGSNVKSNETRVKALEDGSSGAQGACDNTVNWGSSKHTATYEAKTSRLGDILTFNGEIYRIIEVPFREFGTGDIYKVRLPVLKNNYHGVYGTLYTYHTTNVSDCSDLTISGFPARMDMKESRDLFFQYSGTKEVYESALRTYLNVYIKVGETYLLLPPFYTRKVETRSSTATLPTDYDFTSKFETDKMTHDQSLFNFLDNLIDYIQVTKVE